MKFLKWLLKDNKFSIFIKSALERCHKIYDKTNDPAWGYAWLHHNAEYKELKRPIMGRLNFSANPDIYILSAISLWSACILGQSELDQDHLDPNQLKFQFE